MTISFSDVTGITPGDDDEYARILIELWQSADDGENMRRFLEERRVPDAAAQWVYDNLPHTDAHRAVLSQPGLGEKRITEAARVIVSAIKVGGARRDPRMALSNVFDNPSLTRGAIDAALGVANLLPDFVVYSMLMGGALTGGRRASAVEVAQREALVHGVGARFRGTRHARRECARQSGGRMAEPRSVCASRGRIRHKRERG